MDEKDFTGKATNNIENDDEEPIFQDKLIFNVLRDENGRIEPKKMIRNIINHSLLEFMHTLELLIMISLRTVEIWQ